MLMLQLSLATAYFSIAAHRIQSVTLYSLLKLSLHVNCIPKAFRYLLADKILILVEKCSVRLTEDFGKPQVELMHYWEVLQLT